MRTYALVALVASLLAAALLAPAEPALAHDADAFRRRLGLQDPDLVDDPRVERLVELHLQADRLLRAYARLERAIGRAAVGYVHAARRAEAADAAAAEAEATLDARIDAAYELGPGTAVEALLGAETLADLASISEYLARTVALDERVLGDLARARIVSTSLRALAAAELRALEPRLAELRARLGELQERIAEAAALAEEARVEDEWFDEQLLALADAEARARSWEDLQTLTWGEDQAPYLALLEPTGGRTCETPEGLVATGERFGGYASWYGWEFGGQPTAMGAIFDPTLFTAANRWLPMGTFLRVRYGDRCAIVLVNDRGPYGNMERVIDLSMASAHYLGVGVSWVEAEVLVVETPG
jgi:Lytic transglycolase